MTHLDPFLHLVPHVEPPAAVRSPPALVHAEHQERVRYHERSPLVALGAREAAPNDQRAALDAARKRGDGGGRLWIPLQALLRHGARDGSVKFAGNVQDQLLCITQAPGERRVALNLCVDTCDVAFVDR